MTRGDVRMETFKPNHFFRGSAALLATAFFVLPLSGGEFRGGSSLASSELSRRSVAIDEAQELLRKGDEAYTAGRYGEAVEAYAGARDLIPNAPISAELRAAATQRYAQASVEHARILSRNGDVASARAAVSKVLAESVAPNNPGALAFLAQLDDPIRTNPALTEKHAKDVDSVRRLLYTAQGAYDLGKYDEANARYADVLRIDPTNTAARRGMEQVAASKSAYQKSAQDHTRSELLSQIDSQWELKAPPLDLGVFLPDPGSDSFVASDVSVKDKLDRIIIPKVNLDQSSLEEALDFLRLRASENDTLETDPTLRGVNFAVNLGAADSPTAQKIRAARIDLQLTNVPLSQVLKYICGITRTAYTTDDFSVIITPADSSSAELIARTYRVPPDFISSMSTGSSAPAQAEDPFGAAPATGGLLAKRLGAQEALIQQGVNFPEGASAILIPATNTLRVVNTATNQDFVSQVIDTITRTEPVMVSVKVTMIKVEQTVLKELGFDWFLESANFGQNLFASGGTVGNGASSPDLVGPNGLSKVNPITAGNRSGDSAISGSAIDSLIRDQLDRQTSNPAPGILGLAGNFDDSNVQLLMRGLDQKTGVDVMAQPTTVTRSGQSSTIKIIREFIYPTEYEPPELPNSFSSDSLQLITVDENGQVISVIGGGSQGSFPVTPATPTAFETREVGVILEVLPVVDANKQYITVTLNPVFTDFDGFVNYGSPINSTSNGLFGVETVEVTKNAILMPIFSKNAVATSIDVVDGGTVAVGGMVQERIQNVNDKTPILGSIPILGRLFESDAKKPVSKMIIFLVNVELMDPTGQRYRER